MKQIYIQEHGVPPSKRELKEFKRRYHERGELSDIIEDYQSNKG